MCAFPGLDLGHTTQSSKGLKKSRRLSDMLYHSHVRDYAHDGIFKRVEKHC